MSAFAGTKGKPRTITIVVHDGNHFDVHEGERYADRLCWEEMLGQVASMTHPKINIERYTMLTPEEHGDKWAALKGLRIPE